MGGVYVCTLYLLYYERKSGGGEKEQWISDSFLICRYHHDTPAVWSWLGNVTYDSCESFEARSTDNLHSLFYLP